MTTSRQRAGWYRDPARRFELRYWDGTHWTTSIMEAGIRAVDDDTTAPPTLADVAGPADSADADDELLAFAAAADLQVVVPERAPTSGAAEHDVAATDDRATARPAPPRIASWPQPIVVALAMGAGGLVVGALLPWAQADSAHASFSESGIDRYGAVTILAACVVVLVTILLSWSARAAVLVAACGVVALGVAVHVFDTSRKADALLERSSTVVSAGVGSGLWLTLGAAVVVFGAGTYAAVRSRR